MYLQSTRMFAALLTLSIVWSVGLAAQTAEAPDSSSGAVEQLRYAVGQWDVTTEFRRPDGSVARSVQGVYEFDWVVEDRVLAGRTSQNDSDQVSAILFYYREDTNELEQVSVGADGQLWIMTGPADGNVRTTPVKERPDGSSVQLRFTHYNVEPDRFESKMEVTRDSGTTWVQRNHQVLTRRSSTPN